MNSTGGTKPSSSSVQRASASKPRSLPSSRSDDRLAVGLQRAVGDRAPQPLLQHQPALAGRRHLGVVDLHPVAPAGLRRAAGRRRTHQRASRSSRSSVADRPVGPARTRRPTPTLADVARPGECRSIATPTASRSRSPSRSPSCEVTRAEDGELVAAEAGGHPVGRAGAADRLGDGHQQGVPGLVAEDVVDLLEAVEVEGEHGPGPLVVHAGDPGRERPAVRQPGERVAVGLLAEVPGELDAEQAADDLADADGGDDQAQHQRRPRLDEDLAGRQQRDAGEEDADRRRRVGGQGLAPVELGAVGVVGRARPVADDREGHQRPAEAPQAAGEPGEVADAVRRGVEGGDVRDGVEADAEDRRAQSRAHVADRRQQHQAEDAGVRHDEDDGPVVVGDDGTVGRGEQGRAEAERRAETGDHRVEGEPQAGPRRDRRPRHAQQGDEGQGRSAGADDVPGLGVAEGAPVGGDEQQQLPSTPGDQREREETPPGGRVTAVAAGPDPPDADGDAGPGRTGTRGEQPPRGGRRGVPAEPEPGRDGGAEDGEQRHERDERPAGRQDAVVAGAVRPAAHAGFIDRPGARCSRAPASRRRDAR